MNRRRLFGLLLGALVFPKIKAADPHAQFWGDKVKLTTVKGPITFIPNELFPVRIESLEEWTFPDLEYPEVEYVAQRVPLRLGVLE